jgi:arylsulfatase A-like enzyme
VAAYQAMCEWFDLTCGQLMDFLDQRELSENTLTIYVTDNGWIQDPDKKNVYAPKSKREPYEMGIRTPIMFHWPGQIEPEINRNQTVSSIDIATTIYGICGIEAPAGLQGIDVLKREALKAREVIFAETYAHDFTTVDSSLYYLIAIEFPYKLILPDPQNQPDEEVELYNLQQDPHEKMNLAVQEPERVEKLKEKIETWWKP